MFQNAWSTNQHGKDRNNTIISFPPNFIKVGDLDAVRTIYWDEHCLECSAPACYSTCPLYLKRPDGACRRFEYGIKVMRRLPDALWKVRLKFRKWAKIEARINKGSLCASEILQMDSRDKCITNVFKFVSKIAGYKLSRKWDGLKRKKYATFNPTSRYVNDFLFQCRYEGDTPFKLIFEIADRQNSVMFKTSFDISTGFNQELLKLDFPLPEGGLVRLYPENNLNVELELYAADLVSIRGAIPDTPAKKLKCIAWDLDNTVWNGTLAEANPDDLQLRTGVSDTIKQLDKRGIIQIVVSKNDRDSVIPVLKRLGILEYFVYVIANWNPKSNNIFFASRMLNFGIDTFALIDDSIFERNEVRDSLACVRVYDENILSQLFNLPELDVPVTKDGAMRRISYLQEASRNEIKASFSGQNSDFIRNCKINLKIGTINTEEARKRSLELLLRTNQLNLSAHRYSESEFDQLLNKNGSISLALWVNDRFGDYGQVAFLHYRVSDKVEITEYAMSCRIAAKLIENALFDWFQKQYKKDIVIIGRKTDRNSTLRDALHKVGFESFDNDISEIKLILQSTTIIPDSDCINVII